MSLNQSFISERCSLGKYPSTQSSFGDALVSSLSVDTRGGGRGGWERGSHNESNESLARILLKEEAIYSQLSIAKKR